MYERRPTLARSKFRQFLLPTLLTTAALSLALVVDGIIVGNLLGERALAAVGLASPLVLWLDALALLFSIGGPLCASVAKGGRNGPKADLLFTLCLAGGLTAMLFSTLIILLFGQGIARLLAQGDEGLAQMLHTYIVPMALSSVLVTLSFSLTQFINLEGRPRRAAAIPLVANLVNLVCDYLFIRYCGLGLMGAGLATACGYIVGLCMVLPYLRAPWRSFRFVPPGRWAGQARRALIETLQAGAAESLSACMQLLRILALNALVLGVLGQVGLTAMTVCNNTMNIAKIVILGVSDAMLPLIGAFFGERDFYGIRETAKSAFVVLGSSCLALTLFIECFPGLVGAWFGVDGAADAAFLTPALRIFALSLPPAGVNYLLKNFYAATGRPLLGSGVVILDTFVLATLFAYGLAALRPDWLWAAFFCAESATLFFLAALSFYLRRRDKDARGMLLLRAVNEPGAVWDTSIPATFEAAVGLSDAVIDFCAAEGVNAATAACVGLAVEEMAVNTAKHGGGSARSLDILLRLTPDLLVLRFRDDGAPFNPLISGAKKAESDEGGASASGAPALPDDDAFSGIQVLRRLASKIEYNPTLGFNTTIIEFKRK
jgi:Na+-driven multidrug efflux pump/anti-sigma regulatory factor (Ser/Thr protein kinase)